MELLAADMKAMRYLLFKAWSTEDGKHFPAFKQMFI